MITSSHYKNKKILSLFFLILVLPLSILFSLDMSPSMAQIKREEFVKEALSHLDAPYKYGMAGPDTFDCSGLVMYSAKKALGINLPRTSKAMFAHCNIIKQKDREIGDLVFFRTEGSSEVNHVGIYIGNNQFVSSQSRGENGAGVKIASLNNKYWSSSYFATGKFFPSGVYKGEEDNKILDQYNDNYFTNEEHKPYNNKNKEEDDYRSYWDDDDEYGYGSFNSANQRKSNQTYKDNKTSSPRKEKVEEKKENWFTLDFTGYMDWSFLKPKEVYHPYEEKAETLSSDFSFSFRGINIFSNISFNSIVLNPGFTIGLRYNIASDVFQIPLLLTLSPGSILRLYGGGVLSFGNAKIPNTNQRIGKGIYHLMFGMSISTPKLEIGKVAVQLVQDISYTDFSNNESFTLSYPKNIYTGLMLSTGVRVTLDL